MTVNRTQTGRKRGAQKGFLSFEVGLSFALHLSLASMHQSLGLQGSQKQMADDETNRMYFNNRIGHPTYEKEHLNLGKTRDSCETNPSQLRRVTPPPLTARKTKWQIDETNDLYVGVKGAGGNRPTYEKDLSNSRKQVILTERITPAEPSLTL